MLEGENHGVFLFSLLFVFSGFDVIPNMRRFLAKLLHDKINPSHSTEDEQSSSDCEQLHSSRFKTYGKVLIRSTRDSSDVEVGSYMQYRNELIATKLARSEESGAAFVPTESASLKDAAKLDHITGDGIHMKQPTVKAPNKFSNGLKLSNCSQILECDMSIGYPSLNHLGDTRRGNYIETTRKCAGLHHNDWSALETEINLIANRTSNIENCCSRIVQNCHCGLTDMHGTNCVCIDSRSKPLPTLHTACSETNDSVESSELVVSRSFNSSHLPVQHSSVTSQR